MKQSHKYNSNFKEEYQKAIKFLKKGCDCDCSATLPKEKFTQLRVEIQNLKNIPDRTAEQEKELNQKDENNNSQNSNNDFPNLTISTVFVPIGLIILIITGLWIVKRKQKKAWF